MRGAVIYLVRHGESEWNVVRRTQGQSPHPRLTDTGRAQARTAARAMLADIGPAAVEEIVSSDLVRATQTAELIAKMLGAPVRVDPRLREQSLGTLEGLSYDESYAAASALDWSDPEMRPGGGESVREVAARMSAALGVLPPDVITVVVSHGDAIRTALLAHTGQQLGTAWLEVPNGSVAVLDGSAPVRWLPVDAPVSPR